MNIDSVKQLLKAKSELENLIDSIQDIDIDNVIEEGSFDPYLKYEDSIFTSWHAKEIESPEDFNSISEFNSFQSLKDFYDKMFGYYGDFVLLANSPVKKSLFSGGASKRKSSFEKLLEKASKASEKLFSEIQLFIDTYSSYDETEEQNENPSQVVEDTNGDNSDNTEQELEQSNDTTTVTTEQEIIEEESQQEVVPSEEVPLHEEIVEEVEEKNTDNQKDAKGDVPSDSKIEESNPEPEPTAVSVSPDEKAIQDTEEVIDENQVIEEQEVIAEKSVAEKEEEEEKPVDENDSLEEFKRKMQEDFEKQIKNLGNKKDNNT